MLLVLLNWWCMSVEIFSTATQLYEKLRLKPLVTGERLWRSLKTTYDTDSVCVRTPDIWPFYDVCDCLIPSELFQFHYFSYSYRPNAFWPHWDINKSFSINVKFYNTIYTFQFLCKHLVDILFFESWYYFSALTVLFRCHVKCRPDLIELFILCCLMDFSKLVSLLAVDVW